MKNNEEQRRQCVARFESGRGLQRKNKNERWTNSHLVHANGNTNLALGKHKQHYTATVKEQTTLQQSNWTTGNYRNLQQHIGWRRNENTPNKIIGSPNKLRQCRRHTTIQSVKRRQAPRSYSAKKENTSGTELSDNASNKVLAKENHTKRQPRRKTAQDKRKKT
ncbi:hypothetical protein TRVL_05390 [Trypanosoma vivax]|nr:hypothetical protein TRVL_05390 [Trypanosoma vivax]